MSYVIKTKIANKANYGTQRSLDKIKYIVIHYTANDGDTDENNGKYFENNIIKASAHYFVDDDSITQSVPDNYVAYSVGGSKYKSCSSTGGGKFYGKCTNTNSISIELCDDVKNGYVYPSSGTIENAIAFTKTLMEKYNIPEENVIRHFDVNGKPCPAYWCGDANKNIKWETEFKNKLTPSPTIQQDPEKDTMDNIPDPWAKEAIEDSVENRILFGDNVGNLKLHSNCTRQEVIVFLYRLYKSLNN